MIKGAFNSKTAEAFSPKEGNLNMNKHYMYNGPLSFIAVMILSTGCSAAQLKNR